MYSEQKVLRISILMTVITSGFSILLGLLARSSAIIFDGIFSLTDTVMTILALLVANLIRMSTNEEISNKKLEERFTMGFWHLEPIVLGLNGMMLVSAAIYALLTAVNSFLSGGQKIVFDYAIFYAIVSLIFEASMAVFTLKANKKIKSDFIAIDARAWIISASMTVAWLLAFAFGYIIQDTSLEWLSSYVDPIILSLVCIIVIPMPIASIKKALSDILLVTPHDLKQEVDEVAQKVVDQYGFAFYRVYVARVGRGKQVELCFVVPEGYPPKGLEEWDKIRDEIEKKLKAESPNYWLTIVFTADPEWQ